MSTTETSFELFPLRLSAAARVKGGLVSMVSWLRALNRNRRAMRDLIEMEEWQLNDIGLTRSDLGIANHHRFFDDPSRHLVNIAQKRGKCL